MDTPPSSAPREVSPGIWVFEKVAPSGWSWNMIAVRLGEGGVMLYSPTFMGEDAFPQVDALGEVRALVAPNHYHHVSIPRFRARYPRAVVLAAAPAIPRLTKQGHTGLTPVEEAPELLPPGASSMVCEGAKSGEAWLSVPGTLGPTWIVCDGFCHLTRKVTGMTGVALRALRVTPGLEISRTYRWLALGDRAPYKAWALEALARDQPRCLVVSHGEPVEESGLAERLASLIRARL